MVLALEGYLTGQKAKFVWKTLSQIHTLATKYIFSLHTTPTKMVMLTN